MWRFLLLISLLIGVILGGCEMDVTLTDLAQSKVDTSSDDQRQKEPKEIYEEQIDPNHQTDATDERVKNEYLEGHPEYDRRIDLDLDSRGVSERRENVDTWLDLAAKSKELRNLPPSSQRRRKKKKKKTTTTMTPWIYQWGNKEKENADKTDSSIRVLRTFNSWGGKRGSVFSTLQENMYDRYGRDLSLDENVKKKADDIEKVRWKVPFNSWGGKRTEQSADRRYLPYLKERIYDAPIFRVYKVYESIKGRNNGKGSDNFLYRIPNHNETSEDDSSTSEDVDGRLIPILEKRTKHHKKCKRTPFNPWAGKRSLKPENVRFDKTIAFLAYSTADKTFLCCYPIKQTK